MILEFFFLLFQKMGRSGDGKRSIKLGWPYFVPQASQQKMNFNISELDYSSSFKICCFLKDRSLYLRHWLQIKRNRSQWPIQTFRKGGWGGGVRSSRSSDKGGGAGLPKTFFRPFGPQFGLKIRPRSAIGSLHI